MESLNCLAKKAYETAKSKGWHNNPVAFGDAIANIHGEVSEAFEEYRNGHKLNKIYTQCEMEEIKERGGGGCGVCKYCPANKPEGIPIEFADIIIRLLDSCAEYGIDIDAAIKVKMAYNETRPIKHGGKIV
jgi:NTP pyrophosphatase (non-canonical NTP hydrolase)